MNLQTVKPRARQVRFKYGDYWVVTIADVPAEFSHYSLESALRKAYRAKLARMVEGGRKC